MSHIADLLQERAADIVSKIPDRLFTTRQFIWVLTETYEIEYIEILWQLAQGKEKRIFHNLHAQIGRYLLDHAEELEIKDCKRRIPETNLFGRETGTEQWEKIK